MVFDVPALIDLSRRIRNRSVRVHTVDTSKPSPFAASVLFRYVANFLYDGDAPLAERRAQALAIDQSQLRELLGEPELRELLDPRGSGTDRARTAESRGTVQGEEHRRSSRSAAAPRRSLRRRARSAIAHRRGRGDPGNAEATSHSRGDDRARQALHRHRGRVALPRCPRHADSARRGRALSRAGGRSGRRSRAPLRAYAWSVHAGRRRPSLRPSASP